MLILVILTHLVPCMFVLSALQLRSSFKQAFSKKKTKSQSAHDEMEEMTDSLPSSPKLQHDNRQGSIATLRSSPSTTEWVFMHASTAKHLRVYTRFSPPCLHVTFALKITQFAVLFLFLNSFQCFHKCLLILTLPFLYLLSRPLCSFFFFNVSPPAVASAFAIASPPPFGRQRKSKTVIWSTSTDLGNRHCVACSQGVCVQWGVLLWLSPAS